MTTPPWQRPDSDARLDASQVHALVAEQHPDLAELTLGPAIEGWDTVVHRLGPHLAVRIPRHAAAAAHAGVEHAWLPRLSAAWGFAVPTPVRMGRPTDELPWAWSIARWIEGEPVYGARLSSKGAGDLGRALAQLHTVAPVDAPRNPFRSSTLAVRAERFDDRVERLIESGVPVDADTARAEYGAGAALRRGVETWCHLDLHGANVLAAGGRLAGILDWGDLGAGDPATDLGQVWCLVGSSRFRDVLHGYRAGAVPLDEAGLLRARAEALGYAATLAAVDEEPYADAGRRALADLGVLAR